MRSIHRFVAPQQAPRSRARLPVMFICVYLSFGRFSLFKIFDKLEQTWTAGMESAAACGPDQS